MKLRKSLRRYYIPVFLAYAVSSTAFFAIAYLLRDPASDAFVRNVVWGEVLLFAAWLPFWVFCRPDAGGDEFSSRQAAILPFLTALVFAYVAASGGLFAYTLFVKDLGNVATAVQTGLAAVVLVLGLGMQMAMSHAGQGTERFTVDHEAAGVFSPRDLAARLAVVEKRLAGKENLVKGLTGLREALTYRLPAVGAVTESPEYHALSRGIDEFIAARSRNEAMDEEDALAAVRGFDETVTLVAARLKR